MSSKPSADPSSSSPPVDPKVWRQKLNFLSWIRVGLGAIAGFLAGALGFVTIGTKLTSEYPYYGLYVAAIVYIASYYLARQFILTNLDPKNKNKLITQGLFSYVMIFLFVWIIFNTLVNITGLSI
ncbi:MAG: hypothetical protein ACYC7D_07685 [Nitrososphaerales archaeon]